MACWSLYMLLLLLSCDVTLTKKKKTEKKETNTLSRGWGDGITWVETYEEALGKAKESNKPLMIIHHLDECPYSQDPSLTVRTDITSKYSNRKFTYEPEDMDLLEENMVKAKKPFHMEL
ncbi:hypothetical protein QTP70_014061 [Hemibagrus guttatus]|uniref:Uncharacterized protein n=1 Tax=Hemibagrus guttatus TaxID=175788 RepID=A0AAE0R4N1_9TELE|nr:hypothetical protein QTP70_014061 [Hemibagrus guttatus]KAK3569033.1 hypothetical protein QTP86_021561 [Hemibagrus guttatus]